MSRPRRSPAAALQEATPGLINLRAAMADACLSIDGALKPQQRVIRLEVLTDLLRKQLAEISAHAGILARRLPPYPAP